METTKRMARAAAVLGAALALAGCVTTGGSVSDEEALANYAQTGIESIVGEWTGSWSGFHRSTTLRVRTPTPGRIEVRYCTGGWCAQGCNTGTCPKGAWKLHDVTFEDETLRFRWKTATYAYTREGARLHGVLKGKYRTDMRRKRTK